MALYNLTSEEIAKVKEVNGSYNEYQIFCSCGIEDNKPSHCKQGPLPETRTPNCGFFFEEVNGELERKGECLRCGRCCAVPRHKGDPYGYFDPRGKACEHLIVEVKNV